MNAFFLDLDPDLRARYHIDGHVTKLALEGLQLLCSAHMKSPYKPTHLNHPWSKWTRKSSSNYIWMLEHTEALLREHAYRYKSSKKMCDVLEWCKDHKLITELNTQTPIPLCLGSNIFDYIDKSCTTTEDSYYVSSMENSVEAYREYYKATKLNYKRSTWKNREKPYWL